MPRHQPAIRWHQLLTMLGSDDPDDRRQGWIDLYHGVRGGSIRITKRRVDKLLALPPEKDQSVQEHLDRAMPLVFAAMHETAVQESAKQVVGAPHLPPTAKLKASLGDSLGEWFWEVFLEASIVAYLIDKRTRDYRAVVLIARVLDLFTFPQVAFRETRLGSFALSVEETAKVRAVCFVGRPCLFFRPETMAGWEWRGARYRFVRLDASESPSVPWPDPRLHRIDEFVGPEVFVPHCAELEGNQLTDYGLIQRYVVVINGHSIVVVVCGGCTFAGTYAAAHWAASDVFQKHGENGLIPRPDKAVWKSPLEALVKVTALLDPDRIRPPQVRVDPIDVRCEGLAWHMDSFGWEKPSPKRAVLYYPEGETPSAANVSDVWLDGHRANLDPDGENRRLLITACLQAKANGRVGSIRSLADDTTIWADGQARNEQQVRVRLTNLKRYFNRSLELGRGSSDFRLNLEVHLVPAAATAGHRMDLSMAAL